MKRFKKKNIILKQMGMTAYVYDVQDTGLKERIDKLYYEKPWLKENDSLFSLRATELIKDNRNISGIVVLGKNMRLHKGNGGTIAHRNDDLQLDYLLAIIVDGPAMAYANGWHSPDQRLEFESSLQKIGINKGQLLYQGIFQGDTDQLIPER